MRVTRIPLSQTQAFSPFFLDYLHQHDSLKPFYHRFAHLASFGEQINEKQGSYTQQHRHALVSTLNAQYDGYNPPEAVTRHIALLKKDTTFTVTTGHQLNLFTGPLYFIYKIITVINACKALKKEYPAYDFVPVYWMASEDHDYDEIKSFRLYGKKYTWNTRQQGAVGRFSTQGLDGLLNELPGDVTLFKEAYLKNKTLSGAVRHYVNGLFGDDGLVVLDADTAALKTLFKDVMKDDILHHTAKKLVDKTDEQLAGLGYKTQVFCRDINFFYLDDQLRSRIEEKDDTFGVVDTDITFTTGSITEAIDTAPEKFSPNVILRPLYQEMILPNLAYVGGPAEVVYWLQLKNVFAHYRTPFPVLMPRNFALVAEPHIMRKFEKTGLAVTSLFEEKNRLFNQWVLKHAGRELSVNTERETMEDIFKNLRERAERIDTTLGPLAAAEEKRALNSLEKIEKKMLRAEKRVHREKLQQIEAVKDALFPNGSLQERTDNFLNFYQKDPAFVKKLLHHFDPFDFQFNVIEL